ncbi:MAG: VOC family protein [Ahrensia sp.]|nr:VOC family protein [Ahrensia sp.]
MTANISIVTLGVDDLPVSTRFYEGLGWVNTTASQDSVTFLQGHSVVLGLYGRSALAEDAEVENIPAGFRGVTLAINLPSRAAVDAFFNKALGTGASAQKQPQSVFWGGYSGYFADPDGHLWEVAHNPFFALNEVTGQLQLEAKS